MTAALHNAAELLLSCCKVSTATPFLACPVILCPDPLAAPFSAFAVDQNEM